MWGNTVADLAACEVMRSSHNSNPLLKTILQSGDDHYVTLEEYSSTKSRFHLKDLIQLCMDIQILG